MFAYGQITALNFACKLYQFLILHDSAVTGKHFRVTCGFPSQRATNAKLLVIPDAMTLIWLSRAKDHSFGFILDDN